VSAAGVGRVHGAVAGKEAYALKDSLLPEVEPVLGSCGNFQVITRPEGQAEIFESGDCKPKLTVASDHIASLVIVVNMEAAESCQMLFTGGHAPPKLQQVSMQEGLHQAKLGQSGIQCGEEPLRVFLVQFETAAQALQLPRQSRGGVPHEDAQAEQEVG
jgi:hypothetical protein